MSATGLRFSVIWVRKASNLVWQIFQFIKLVKDIKYRVFKNESQKKAIVIIRINFSNKIFSIKMQKVGKREGH